EVTLESGVEIGPHVVVEGETHIGKGVKISQFASIGAPPQDLKYKGEPTRVEIADGVIIREFVTVHRGTIEGGGVTRIGRGCLLMAYVHVAHDCQIGANVIMANGATLGGHVVIDENVVIGGLSAVHQFCHIGAYAFLGGMSGVNKDIPPYVKYWGQRGRLYGLNLVGLRRHGLSRENLEALRDAYRMIFEGDGTVADAIQMVEERFSAVPEVVRFVEFIKSSRRGVPLGGNISEISEMD
ncbi:MAG: acyl-ACP--UDP-N-acetylglucosamine O-acyltransferase, partial [Dissulfurimicrobium sp.]